MIKNINTKLAFRNRRIILAYKENPLFMKTDCVKTVAPMIIGDFHILLAAEVKPSQSKFWYPVSVLPEGTIYPTVYMNRNIPTSLNTAVLTFDFWKEEEWQLEIDTVNPPSEDQMENATWAAYDLVIRMRRVIAAHMRYWKESLKIPIMERASFALSIDEVVVKFGQEDD